MSKKSVTLPPEIAYGREGEYFICATCGKSIPITEIEGQCICGKKVCKSCGSRYALCAKCGWVICKDCAYWSKRYEKWYHKQCAPSECLIVTTCFGSPLSAEVQYFRMFRDETVLKTSFGKRLMDIVERIYYSFSPQVAAFLESHPATRDVVKSTIVIPFLESLSASKRFSHSLSNKELRIIFIALLSPINMTAGLTFWKTVSFIKKESRSEIISL